MPIWIHRKAMRRERFVEKLPLILDAKIHTKYWDIEQTKIPPENRLGDSVMKSRFQKRYNAQE